MKVHKFDDCLRRSESAKHMDFWEKTYRKAFPDMVALQDNARDNDAQRGGVDRLVILRSTQILRIQEKARERDYGDILLEYLSNDQSSTPGWMNKDLMIDYLAYGFVPSRRCYLFPWPLLRRAWLHHRDIWIRNALHGVDGFKHVEAKNPNYKTLSVAISTTLLLKTVSRASVIQLDE